MKKRDYLVALFLFLSCVTFAQTRELKGKLFVTDTQMAIPDAVIVVRGDMRYQTKTDSTGQFVIPQAVGDFTIRASKEHFITTSQHVDSEIDFMVLYMNPDPNFFGKVDQAFGQKTTEKANTNSPGEVKFAASNTSSRDLLNRLRTVPGVEVSPTGEITIRGVNSINSVGPPLIVVDGSPFIGGLGSLNPQDIDRITVLKGAETAMYGSRGASGVILITTKKK